MCNLYRSTMPQEVMRTLFKVRPEFDRLGNYEPARGIYPDKDAPVVRTRRDGERELVLMRWGFPSPQPKGRPVTNVRNLASGNWRPWLGTPEIRCLVPVTSFAEPHPTRKDARGWKDNEWLAVRDTEGFAFAGIRRPWTGEPSIGNRQKEERDWQLFAFVTCEPNELVRPIHEKAMPVIVAPDD